MTRTKNGFSVIEVILVLAVVALIGFIGWRVWQTTMTSDQPAETTGESSQQNVEQAPEIKEDGDLDKATQTLDDTNVEGSESSQLDSETSF